jgi:4-carboxymuconolactone decarboxylase
MRRDVFAIYPGNGIPSSSEKWSRHEQTMQVPMSGSTALTTMVWNVVIPTVTLFKPAVGIANGTSLIVVPGGAFRQKNLGGFAPKLVELTDDVLFGDVWERKELSPRGRSLITVAALIAGGNSEQLSFHLGKAKENGLTETELIEVITHLAFYAGYTERNDHMEYTKLGNTGMDELAPV